MIQRMRGSRATADPVRHFLQLDIKSAETGAQRLLIVVGGAVQGTTGIIANVHDADPFAQRAKIRSTTAPSRVLSGVK